MPGIFGVLSKRKNNDINRKLIKGINQLIRKPYHYFETVVCNSFGIAVAFRGKNLNGADLWHNDDKSVCVALNGELYSGPDILNVKIVKPTSRCGEYIYYLYHEHGTKWINKISGAFSGILVDTNKNKAYLFNDRYGLRPIYYAKKNDIFLFGSLMASITTAYPDLNWQYDFSAISDLFTFEHVLGEKTFVKSMSVLENASVLDVSLPDLSISKNSYWNISSTKISSISYSSAVEEANYLFNNAIMNQCKDNKSYGVYLTSGLDSRTIAGFLRKQNIGFKSFTYGLDGCRDIVWGKEIAKKTASRHEAFLLDDGSWLFESADDFIKCTESFVNVFHSHGISTYDKVGESIDVHISGYGGGSFTGGDTTSVEALNLKDHKAIAENMLYHYRFALGNAFRCPLDHKLLFNSDIAAKNDTFNLAKESFLSEFNKYKSIKDEFIGDAFTLNNRYKKMFAYLISVERDCFEDRSPFFDYDYLDFIFSIPMKHKIGRKLQIGMIGSALPKLKWIPWQTTTLPPTSRKIELSMFKQKRKLLRQLYKLFNIDYKIPTEPGRNYPKWLYENGMAWATEIVNSKEFVQRAIFNKHYLMGLIDHVPFAMKNNSYQYQRSLAYRIGLVLTFELMCRNVFDV